MNSQLSTSLRIAAFACTLALVAAPASAADHRDGPVFFDNPGLVHRDINDIFIFRSPTNTDNTVIAMTFQPFPGVISPDTFHPTTKYGVNIDHTTPGDAVPDLRFIATFAKLKRNATQQEVKLRLLKRGSSRLVARGMTGETLQIEGGGQFTAGIFDDPFFFDVFAFRDGGNFNDPGSNFFRKFNTLAMVIEVPTATLLGPGTPPNPNISAWATAHKGSRQIDRMAGPAINSVVIPKALRDAFNRAAPKNDERDFHDVVVATLVAPPFNRAPGAAEGCANFVLPDVLHFNTASSAGFPNGRRLTDDVIDAQLQLFTGNSAASDFVGTDSPFRLEFPYLAPANP